MKNLYITALFLIIPILVFAQDSTSDDNDDEFYEEEYEELPLNAFFRITTNLFMVNSVPSDIDFLLTEDDFFVPDTLSSSFSTGNLWTYGFGLEVAQLFGNDYVWSFSNHVGWGDKAYFFTYITQIGIGKEFRLGKIYAQPMASLGFISSSYWMDEFNNFDKGFFAFNQKIIVSSLVAKFKSRAFSVSPSLSLDFPINETLSIYAKGTAFYTIGRKSFVRITGTTDEVNEEGENITAYERVNFADRRLELRINNQLINDVKSPFLHYNLNSIFVQFGITLSFSSLGTY